MTTTTTMMMRMTMSPLPFQGLERIITGLTYELKTSRQHADGLRDEIRGLRQQVRAWQDEWNAAVDNTVRIRRKDVQRSVERGIGMTMMMMMMMMMNDGGKWDWGDDSYPEAVSVFVCGTCRCTISGMRPSPTPSESAGRTCRGRL
jgi:hypothetical protein